MLLALAEKTEAPVTLQKHVYFCVNCSKYPSSSINLYVYLSLSLCLTMVRPFYCTDATEWPYTNGKKTVFAMLS